MFLLRSGRPSARRTSTRVLTALSGTLLTPARLAQGRAGIGVAMLVQPAALPQRLGVDSAAARRTSWVSSMLGAREVALGLGTLVALRRVQKGGDPRAARLWLMAGILCDTVDALAVARAVGAGQATAAPGLGLVGVAGTATALQVAALTGDGPLGRSPAGPDRKRR